MHSPQAASCERYQQEVTFLIAVNAPLSKEPPLPKQYNTKRYRNHTYHQNPHTEQKEVEAVSLFLRERSEGPKSHEIRFSQMFPCARSDAEGT